MPRKKKQPEFDFLQFIKDNATNKSDEEE